MVGTRSILGVFTLLGALLTTLSPAADEYRLGPGDTVRVTVYEHPDLTTVSRITDDGSIPFPLLGEVAIARLSELLRDGQFVRRPQVTVNIEQYGSQSVSVLGQVNKAGRYPVQGHSTAIEMLAMAGGLDADAADTVTVIRKGAQTSQRYEIDLVGLFQSGDLQQNIAVANGDIIFVPRMPVFYIYGEVQRPGSYRLEKNMTVMQALSVGGGLTARGTERGTKVKRVTGDGSVETLEVTLTDRLKDNDVVYVKEGLF
jgi:polysaccharide export outer membrane protein